MKERGGRPSKEETEPGCQGISERLNTTVTEARRRANDRRRRESKNQDQNFCKFKKKDSKTKEEKRDLLLGKYKSNETTQSEFLTLVADEMLLIIFLASFNLIHVFIIKNVHVYCGNAY